MTQGMVAKDREKSSVLNVFLLLWLASEIPGLSDKWKSLEQRRLILKIWDTWKADHIQVHGIWWDAPMSAEGQYHYKGILDFLCWGGNQKFPRMEKSKYIWIPVSKQKWFLMLNPNPFQNTRHLLTCKRLSGHFKNFKHLFWRDSVYSVEIFLITSEALFRKRKNDPGRLPHWL